MNSLVGDAVNLANQPSKTFLQMLAMDHMTGVAGAMRSRLMAERLAIKTADGTLGKEGSPVDEALKDMNVSVGDTIYIQAPERPQQSTLTQSSPTPATEPTPVSGEPPARSRLWHYVATAALGGGLGAGAVALGSMLGGSGRDAAPPAVAPTVVDTDTDTDTQYTIGPARIRAKDRADE